MIRVTLVLTICNIAICFAAQPLSKRQKTFHGVPLSDNDRVIEELPEGYLNHTDPIIANFVPSVLLSDSDNDVYTPYLSSNSTWEWTPEGFLMLRTMESRDATRVIFSIKNHTRKFILYEHDCVLDGSFPSTVHPLVSRTAYALAADPLSAQPRVLFISPPTPMRASPKTFFVMSQDQFQFCFASGATVRYAILEPPNGLVPIPLDRFVYHVYNRSSTTAKAVSRVFRIGESLIKLLKALHERQIVHGNLRPDAVIVFSAPGKRFAIRFIDFTKAGWVNPMTGKMIHNRMGIRMHLAELVWLSPWEMREAWGRMYSKMDDVFRAVEVIAVLICNVTTRSPEKRMKMFYEKTLLQYKLSNNLFGDCKEQLTVMNPVISSMITIIEGLAVLESHQPAYDRIAQYFKDISKALEATI